MSFTVAQLQAIKAAINGNAAAAANIAAGNSGLVAQALNGAPPSGQVLIWMPDLQVSVLLTAVTWSEFIALTQGQRDAWRALTAPMTVDATNANVRAGFSAVFSAPSSPSLTALAAIAQRGATWLESLFTTGGVTSFYNYQATVADVLAAMGS